VIAALARLLRRSVPRHAQDRRGIVPRPAPAGSWRTATYCIMVTGRADEQVLLPVASIGELVIDGGVRAVGVVGVRRIPYAVLKQGTREFRHENVRPMAWLHPFLARGFRSWQPAATPLDRFLAHIGLDAEHAPDGPAPACLTAAAGDAAELAIAARGYVLAHLEGTYILTLTAHLDAAAVLDDRSLGWAWIAEAAR
jgi:hypothetical protein